MKKIIIVAALIMASLSVYAYNPPFGGEDMYALTNPELMSGSNSTSGGPSFTISPGSIAYNPALTALEQRNVLDLSATLLFDTDKDYEDAKTTGWGTQLGIIIPTKLMVYTGVINGVFNSIPGLMTGDSFTFRGGASKELMENLSIGANVYTGFFFGGDYKSDFTAGIDLGALYQLGTLGALKNARLGIALVNMGKPLTSEYGVLGINGEEGGSFPGIFTPRFGFSANVLELQNMKAGFSADLYFPTFQNAIFDLGLGATYNDFLKINIGWGINAREAKEGGSDGISWPSIGIGCKFKFTSQKIGERNAEWQNSEITPDFAWKNYYNGINAISGGAKVYLGMKDVSAPEIYLLDDEDESSSSDSNQE